MMTKSNAKLIHHPDSDQIFLAVEDSDGRVTLWNAGCMTFKSRHASIDTAFNEACRIIGHDRFSKFAKENSIGTQA